MLVIVGEKKHFHINKRLLIWKTWYLVLGDVKTERLVIHHVWNYKIHSTWSLKVWANMSGDSMMGNTYALSAQVQSLVCSWGPCTHILEFMPQKMHILQSKFKRTTDKMWLDVLTKVELTCSGIPTLHTRMTW